MDWNDDGLSDLIVGEHNGHVKYFMAVTADSLTEMDDLQADGVAIDAGLVAAPAVFDWNNDSLKDLIVGFPSPATGSTIKLYMNIGTPGNPILDAGVDVLCGGEPVEAYGCAPCMIDLDDDGLTDIVYGEAPGGIYFCKNTGTISSPVFAAPEALQTASGNISLNLNSSPFVTDWNEDGYLDLLAGNGETGHVFAFLSPYTSGISHSNSPEGDLTVQLLTNPACSSICISVISSHSEELSTFLYTLDGRLAQNLGATQLQYGENTLQFEIDPLPSGIYLLRVSSDHAVAGKLLTIIGGAQ